MAIRNLIGDITENDRIVGLNIIQEMPYGWEFNGCKITEPEVNIADNRVVFYEVEPTICGSEFGGWIEAKLRRKYDVPLSACMIIYKNEVCE